jgi:hypothetical protein
MHNKRRDFLASISTLAAFGIAGCNDSSSDPNAPAPDTNPRGLLPTPPDGWEIETEANQQAAGMIGAEAGYSRSFDGPNGDHYAVEFYRFPSNSDARDQASRFSDFGWSVYVARGNFGFAGKGPDVDNVYLMMGNSTAMTEEYARKNNML